VHAERDQLEGAERGVRERRDGQLVEVARAQHQHRAAGKGEQPGADHHRAQRGERPRPDGRRRLDALVDGQPAGEEHGSRGTEHQALRGQRGSQPARQRPARRPAPAAGGALLAQYEDAGHRDDEVDDQPEPRRRLCRGRALGQVQPV
jgi:hypothetical protein